MKVRVILPMAAAIALVLGSISSASAFELLELAGDLVPVSPATPPPAATGTVLLAALHLAGAEALRCLARVPAATMKNKDL